MSSQQFWFKTYNFFTAHKYKSRHFKYAKENPTYEDFKDTGKNYFTEKPGTYKLYNFHPWTDIVQMFLKAYDFLSSPINIQKQYIQNIENPLIKLTNHIEKTRPLLAPPDPTSLQRELSAYRAGLVTCAEALRTDTRKNMYSVFDEYLDKVTFNGLTEYLKQQTDTKNNQRYALGEEIKNPNRLAFDGGPEYLNVRQMSTVRQQWLQEKMNHITQRMEVPLPIPNEINLRILLHIKQFLDFSNYGEKDTKSLLVFAKRNLNELTLEGNTRSTIYGRNLRTFLLKNIDSNLAKLDLIPPTVDEKTIHLTEAQFMRELEQARQEGFLAATMAANSFSHNPGDRENHPVISPDSSLFVE